jgi:hypothetical protein
MGEAGGGRVWCTISRAAVSKGQKIERKMNIFSVTFDEICALLGYYATYSGNFVPTSRNNPLVLYPDVKSSGFQDL